MTASSQPASQEAGYAKSNLDEEGGRNALARRGRSPQRMACARWVTASSSPRWEPGGKGRWCEEQGGKPLFGKV